MWWPAGGTSPVTGDMVAGGGHLHPSREMWWPAGGTSPVTGDMWWPAGAPHQSRGMWWPAGAPHRHGRCCGGGGLTSHGDVVAGGAPHVRCRGRRGPRHDVVWPAGTSPSREWWPAGASPVRRCGGRRGTYRAEMVAGGGHLQSREMWWPAGHLTSHGRCGGRPGGHLTSHGNVVAGGGTSSHGRCGGRRGAPHSHRDVVAGGGGTSPVTGDVVAGGGAPTSPECVAGGHLTSHGRCGGRRGGTSVTGDVVAGGDLTVQKMWWPAGTHQSGDVGCAGRGGFSSHGVWWPAGDPGIGSGLGGRGQEVTVRWIVVAGQKDKVVARGVLTDAGSCVFWRQQRGDVFVSGQTDIHTGEGKDLQTPQEKTIAN
ncbi:loricrin-like [Homarus americanus]|uniref:loricrin-like n=1 Tax=Homarus americanus TaxID=6706 RepID=UPI001C489935|nr:loricrin-like [Homarus americanus]